MKLHFWNTSQLAQELRNGSIDSNRAFAYFAAWLVFVTAVSYYSIYLMGPPDQLSISEGVLGVLITALGLWRCFVANGGDTGHQPLERFVSLSLPIAIKLRVLFEAVYWPLYFLYPQLTKALSDADYEFGWRLIYLVMALLLLSTWFWRVAYWLRRIRGGK